MGLPHGKLSTSQRDIPSPEQVPLPRHIAWLPGTVFPLLIHPAPLLFQKRPNIRFPDSRRDRQGKRILCGA